MDDTPTYAGSGEWGYEYYQRMRQKELLQIMFYGSAEIKIHWEPPGFSYAPGGWSRQLELWERQMREK